MGSQDAPRQIIVGCITINIMVAIIEYQPALSQTLAAFLMGTSQGHAGYNQFFGLNDLSHHFWESPSIPLMIT